jgi:hypothetical protein
MLYSRFSLSVGKPTMTKRLANRNSIDRQTDRHLPSVRSLSPLFHVFAFLNSHFCLAVSLSVFIYLLPWSLFSSALISLILSSHFINSLFLSSIFPIFFHLSSLPFIHQLWIVYFLYSAFTSSFSLFSLPHFLFHSSLFGSVPEFLFDPVSFGSLSEGERATRRGSGWGSIEPTLVIIRLCTDINAPRVVSTVFMPKFCNARLNVQPSNSNRLYG